ncbi:MAG TPA: response regulator [Myxococcales bacterium]|nr:response regulator [Myxococcales bacterium]
MHSQTQGRVLVVDDEGTILFAMGEFLSRIGFEVHTASEREEAEALLAQNGYVGLIADLRLLGSDSREGLEVIAAARERSREIRIILLSAFACAELDREARLRGADAVLRKPRPLSEVAACLVGLLKGPR